MANLQVQRKMRIAHYGRTKSAKFEDKIAAPVDPLVITTREEKRCSFITANSGTVDYLIEEGKTRNENKIKIEISMANLCA